MRIAILSIILLISVNCFSQEKLCDSIMKQIDFQIESAKKNGSDAATINYLKQAKENFRQQYCKNGVFYNNGSQSNTNGNGNGNGTNTNSNNNIQNPNIKTKPYAGPPFYGKQKIAVSLKISGVDGTEQANYSYYVNKEGTIVLLDQQSIEGNMSLIPSNDGEAGTFQFWAIRNDGLSTVFALSPEEGKVAVTTYVKNFLLSPKNNTKPNTKKLNQSKTIAGYNCTAYKVTLQDAEGKVNLTYWITEKPLAFNHDILPFTTMFMADKAGFPNLKNHGVLEINGTMGADSINLKITKIESSSKSVIFTGYKEYFLEY